MEEYRSARLSDLDGFLTNFSKFEGLLRVWEGVEVFDLWITPQNVGMKQHKREVTNFCCRSL